MAKILVVDDDEINRMILETMLEGEGYDVVLAENGIEAIAQYEDEQPDVILMDIMMPEMDGYEAMRTIRKKSAFRKLPIIALTAKAMKDDRRACLDAGANDYMTKPIDVDRLLSLLHVWLY